MATRLEYWTARTRDFTQPHARLQLIRELIDALPRPMRSVLDVGCGGGALKRLLPDTLEYFGVDLAADVIAEQNDPQHFQVADLETASQLFDGRTFDLVVCSGICEYIWNWDRFLELVRHGTAANGILILTCTNRQHYVEVIQHKQSRDPHVNFRSIPEVVASLRRHGFDVLRYTSITIHHRTIPIVDRFWSFPLNLFNRQYLFVCQLARDNERSLKAYAKADDEVRRCE